MLVGMLGALALPRVLGQLFPQIAAGRDPALRFPRCYCCRSPAASSRR